MSDRTAQQHADKIRAVVRRLSGTGDVPAIDFHLDALLAEITRLTAASEDPTAGLPADLVSALRDPNVVVPQDAALFDLLAKWKNAPSDTASAETPEGEGR